MRYSVMMVIACAACTVDNPSYVGGGAPSDGDGGSGGPGSSAPDLAHAHGGGHPDLAIAPGPHDDGGSGTQSFDLAAPLCSPGSRRCVSSPALTAEVCSGGQWRDRECPAGSVAGSGSSCTNGHCTPPTTNGTTSCDTGGPLEQVCSQNGNGPPEFSCQPFLTDSRAKAVEWWCAMAIGAGSGGAGAACTRGSDCHSGFCGSNGTCFWACQIDGDCPTVGMRCNAVTLEVEGVAVSAPSCM
jgi:hypothetical protein